MDLGVLLRKLIQIEILVGLETPNATRIRMHDAQDCLLNLESELLKSHQLENRQRVRWQLLTGASADSGSEAMSGMGLGAAVAAVGAETYGAGAAGYAADGVDWAGVCGVLVICRLHGNDFGNGLYQIVHRRSVAPGKRKHDLAMVAMGSV
jgi:hypothetical protein